MFRLATSLTVLLAALGTPALAADYGDNWGEMGLRDSVGYEPRDWSDLGDGADVTDTVSIEAGIRYWYSLGSQSIESSGGTTTANSTAHTGELHLRVEDNASSTFGQGIAGYSMAISGEYSGPVVTSSIEDGAIGYAGADFGWNALSDGNGNGLGGFLGYMYWNESPDTGRTNFSTLSTGDTVTYSDVTGQTFIPGDSAPNHVDINALRLGLQGKATFSNFIDIRAEVAAVPYAKVYGVMGIEDPNFSTAVYAGDAQPPYSGLANGNIMDIRSSETSIDGWGYGAMAEAFVGIHPTENLTFRLGGRAWYVQGTADTTFDAVHITDPEDADADPDYEVAPIVTESSYIQTNNPFSFLRYGILAELTYAF